MRIEKIHLFNFRSVENLTLDLTADGLHALVGAFGSGKSSFITGVRFALFGDNGAAGTNTDLRYRNAADGAEAGCEVTFTQGQTRYVARRSMRRSMTRKGATEKTSATLSINGQPVDGITPTTLTREMEDVLGMNAKAFTSASMVPQGEVDALMKSTPSEVQKLIEQHTGLDTLTKARDAARKQAATALTKADALPGTEEEWLVAATELGECEKELATKETAVTTAATAVTEAQTAYRNRQHTVEALRAQNDQAANAENTITRLRGRVEFTHEATVKAKAELDAAGIDPLNTSTNQVDTITADLDHLTSLAQNLTTANRDVANAEAEKDAADLENQKATKRRGELNRTRADAETTLTTLAGTIDTTNQEKATWAAEKATHQANATRLNKAIATLTTDGGKHTCPTCQQHVNDVADLVADLENQVADENRHVTDAHTKYTNLVNTLTRMENQRETARNTIAGVDKELATIGHAQLQADNAQKRYNQAIQERGRVASALATMLENHGVTPGDDLLATARTAYKSLSAHRDTLVTATAMIHRYNQAIQEENQAVAQLEAAETNGVPERVPADTLATAVTDAETAQDALTAAQQVHNDALMERSATKATYAILADKEENARILWNKKDKAQKQATEAQLEATALAALRADLLADYTQAICQAATDLLEAFGGEFVAFHLDETFIPQVELADGTLVKTSVLSGGEASLVGLAFRIGITLHITGGGLPEQLIGDEITSYLDDAGRRAIVEAITRIFPSVLLVSHTEEAYDYATVVHRVTRPELGATQFQGQAPTTPEQTLAA